MKQRSLLRAAIGLIVAFGTISCGPPDAGTALADKLRALNNPVVASVRYDAYNDGSGPYLMIVVKPGVSGPDARDFGCRFVVPAVAAAADELPEDFVWDILDSTTEHAFSHEEMPCPAD